MCVRAYVRNVCTWLSIYTMGSNVILSMWDISQFCFFPFLFKLHSKLLKIRSIRPVKRATWLSPIVIVPEKNGTSGYTSTIGSSTPSLLQTHFPSRLLTTYLTQSRATRCAIFWVGSAVITKSGCTTKIKKIRRL